MLSHLSRIRQTEVNLPKLHEKLQHLGFLTTPSSLRNAQLAPLLSYNGINFSTTVTLRS